MRGRVLRTLAVEDYRSLRSLVLPLGALTVVTGGNGTGKSSLYLAVRLLALTAGNGAASALAAEGASRGSPSPSIDRACCDRSPAPSSPTGRCATCCGWRPCSPPALRSCWSSTNRRPACIPASSPPSARPAAYQGGGQPPRVLEQLHRGPPFEHSPARLVGKPSCGARVAGRPPATSPMPHCTAQYGQCVRVGGRPGIVRGRPRDVAERCCRCSGFVTPTSRAPRGRRRAPIRRARPRRARRLRRSQQRCGCRPVRRAREQWRR